MSAPMPSSRPDPMLTGPETPTKPNVIMIFEEAGMRRVYCDGAISKATLAAQLDGGFVATDVVRNGHGSGDVAYFRKGTPEEIEYCRRLSAASPNQHTGA